MFLGNTALRKGAVKREMQSSESGLRAGFIDYIANRMSGEERLRFEQRLLADQEFSDAAAACEQELIDDYASGQLTREERETVAAWIAGSPARQQRVKMARALMTLQHEPKRSSRPVAALLALAACIAAGVALVVAHGVWQRNVVSPQIAAATQPRAVAPVASAVKPDIILLVAEHLRGPEQEPSFFIHRGAPVKLQIAVPHAPESSSFEVRVVALNGRRQIVADEKGIALSSTKGLQYLAIDLQPDALTQGSFAATVKSGDEVFILRFGVKQAQ